MNKQSVTNYGTITGTGGTAISFQYSDDWLKIAPSAVFVGKVEGFGGALGNGIELASAAGVGVISGIGSQFIDFGNVAVDPGARWRLAGANSLVTSGTVSLASGGALIVAGSLVAGPALTLAGGGALGVGASGVVEVGTAGGARMGRITVDPGATVIGSGRLFGAMTDAGTIEAQGGRLSLGGAVAGRGTAAIDTGATLLALNNLKTSSIQFLAGASESLLLNRPTMVTGRISGFNAAGSGDRIELLGFEVTGSAFSANTLTLSGAGGAAMLRFAGSYSLANFHMSSDHHNGTNITFV